MKARGLLLLAVCFILAEPAPLSAYTLRESWRRSIDVEEGSRFALVNASGAVAVEGWEEPRIDIVAEIRIKAPSKSKARSLYDGVRIVVEAGAGRVSVRSDLPRVRQDGFLSGVFGQMTSISVRYTVKVPRRTRLAVENGRGSILLEGIDGSFDCRTGGGDIAIRSFRGAGKAQTHNGGIVCSIDELPEGGDLSLAAANGGITLRLPPGAGGRFEARAVNGRVEMGVPLGGEVERSRSGAKGVIGRGGGTIRLRTVNGRISVEPL